MRINWETGGDIGSEDSGKVRMKTFEHEELLPEIVELWCVLGGYKAKKIN